MVSKWIRIAVLVGAAALPLSAQDDKPKPAAPATTPTPVKFGDVTFSGSFRTRLENWNFFDAGPGSDGEYNFSGNILRLSLSQKRDQFDWQIEAAVPFLIGLPEHAIAAAPQGVLGLGGNYFAAEHGQNAVNIFVKQAFVRWTSAEDPPSSARFGRFEFIDGLENRQPDPTLGFLKRERIGHRLVGNFGFSHVGRSFDGIEFKRDTGRHNLTIMAGRATRGVFQTDGIGELDVDIAYLGYTRSFQTGKKHPGEWRAFLLHYHDGRTGSNTVKVDNRPLAARLADPYLIRLVTLGGHYLQTASLDSAKADLTLWTALQLGPWGILDQRAYAFAIEGGLQPDWTWKPWFRGGLNYHSGDSDPNDGKNTTFFEALSTPRIYARFPFYNRMNLKDAFGQLILRPHPRLSIRMEGHRLWLTEANDLWYAGGGAFAQKNFGFAGRPSGGSTDLGTVVDLGIDWNVNRSLTLSGYYGHAFGGEVIQNLFPSRSDADFAYLEAIYRF